MNDRPLTNEKDVINKLEPVEYDQTYNLVDRYTLDAPQSYQCGFIAQSAQRIHEFKHAVVGGELDENGHETLRSLNCNAILTCVVKAIQELSQLVKAQQMQIDELKQPLRTTC